LEEKVKKNRRRGTSHAAVSAAAAAGEEEGEVKCRALIINNRKHHLTFVTRSHTASPTSRLPGAGAGSGSK